jgi:hypothetical protein
VGLFDTLHDTFSVLVESVALSVFKHKNGKPRLFNFPQIGYMGDKFFVLCQPGNGASELGKFRRDGLCCKPHSA